MQLPTTEQFEVFVPRNDGHVLVKLTVLNDRPSLDFIHTAFLSIVVDMLSRKQTLPDGCEKCITVTGLLTYLLQRQTG